MAGKLIKKLDHAVFNAGELITLATVSKLLNIKIQFEVNGLEELGTLVPQMVGRGVISGNLPDGTLGALECLSLALVPEKFLPAGHGEVAELIIAGLMQISEQDEKEADPKDLVVLFFGSNDQKSTMLLPDTIESDSEEQCLRVKLNPLNREACVQEVQQHKDEWMRLNLEQAPQIGPIQ